ncbi:hypothetical protein FACS1894211_16300 [Clostridia bacterium]|nr:hypothetical protein FACS1894211_16300 [Clostridia bacterium]
MQQKPKRITAIVALVFVLIFTVFFILYLLDNQMGDGWIGAITLISFIIGGGLSGFILIVNSRDLKVEQRQKQVEKDLRENAAAEADDKKPKIQPPADK